ncbi:MAG TPA: tetratricopeptide repeat protein [Polyangiaceae bacterium]
MDQFSAHLDRGWDLVQRGDTRGAEASARRALEIDPQSPEAYNLLGYVAALEGEASEAIESYRQAIALDETYLEAMLNAAEVYIHPLAEFDEAVNMCDQALDLAETDEEVIDALLLKFDAMLGKGDVKEAAQVIGRVPEGPYKNPNHTFLIGRAYYEIGEIDRASGLIEEAAAREPTHAEAHYYLGLVRDERGDSRGATAAFLRCRQLDLETTSPSWSLPRELFAKTVEKAVLSLDPILSRYVRDASVHVSDVPGIELVADGVDPRALVLLDGLGTPDGPPQSASRIFVYQRNIERLSGGTERLEQEITSAFEREITATFLEGDSAHKDKRDLN